MSGGIYTLRFDGADEFYVGKAASFHKRRLHHEWCLRAGKHGNRRLSAMFQRYGVPKFVEEEQVATEADRVVREQWWLDTYLPTGRLINFLPRSIQTGPFKRSTPPKPAWNRGLPSPTKGVPRSEEVRRRISEAKRAKSKPKPPKVRKPRGPHTVEARAKISAARMGIKFSPETIERMRQAALRRERGDRL